jgi:hypothetical protein
MRKAEPLLASLLHENVLGRPTFEAALAARIAAKLHVNEMKEASLRETFSQILHEAPEIGEKAGAAPSRSSSRCASRRCSRSTSTPARASARAS